MSANIIKLTKDNIYDYLTIENIILIEKLILDNTGVRYNLKYFLTFGNHYVNLIKNYIFIDSYYVNNIKCIININNINDIKIYKYYYNYNIYNDVKLRIYYLIKNIIIKYYSNMYMIKYLNINNNNKIIEKLFNIDNTCIYMNKNKYETFFYKNNNSIIKKMISIYSKLYIYNIYYKNYNIYYKFDKTEIYNTNTKYNFINYNTINLIVY